MIAHTQPAIDLQNKMEEYLKTLMPPARSPVYRVESVHSFNPEHRESSSSLSSHHVTELSELSEVSALSIQRD